MAITCWAPDCYHNNVREKCQFFRFPKDGKILQKWLKLLRRDAKPTDSSRVCSCHFPGGKKENLPELFEHNVGKIFQPHHLTPEKKTKKTRRIARKVSQTPRSEVFSVQDTPRSEVFSVQDLAESVEPTASTSAASDIEVTMTTPTTSKGVTSSTVMLEAEIFLLKSELEKKEKLLKSIKMHFTYAHICENDKLILEYTGLPTNKIFQSLNSFISNIKIQYHLKWSLQKLSRTDQLLMTLMKLRQNFTHVDLAFRFQVSEATVTNIVVTFIHVLHEVLYKKLMQSIPSRRKNRSCLPNCFTTFTNARIIVDCTEVFSTIPRQSMHLQKLTYSSYKHRNTWKGLVGVAPNGVVTFISSLYPGSTSDKQIVQHCNILEQLEAGDLIIADKGFLIRDILPPGVVLNIPPFLMDPQFTPEQVRRTQCIARARIHVERAIRRMKGFSILDFIPEPLFSYGSIIFKTVGALTNFQYPLIKEVGQFYVDAPTEK